VQFIRVTESVTKKRNKIFFAKASEAEIWTRVRRRYLTSFAGLHFENGLCVILLFFRRTEFSVAFANYFGHILGYILMLFAVSGGEANDDGVAASDTATAGAAVGTGSQLAHAVNPAALGYYLLPGYQSPYSSGLVCFSAVSVCSTSLWLLGEHGEWRVTEMQSVSSFHF